MSEILHSNSELTQMNTLPTRKGEILEVVISNMYAYYNSPLIIPPVSPDDPDSGVPSDHDPVVCHPNCDPDLPPKRVYKTVSYRPLPQSAIIEFGSWVTRTNWDFIKNCNLCPDQQAALFESTMNNVIEFYFPTK